MAKHWKTGEPIPASLVSKIRAAKNFRAASGMLRQVLFATTDLALHELPDASEPGAAQRVKPRDTRLLRSVGGRGCGSGDLLSTTCCSGGGGGAASHAASGGTDSAAWGGTGCSELLLMASE